MLEVEGEGPIVRETLVVVHAVIPVAVVHAVVAAVSVVPAVAGSPVTVELHLVGHVPVLVIDTGLEAV